MTAYLRALRAHRVAAAVVLITTLLAALLWMALRPPTYEASAQLLINPLPQDDETFLGLELLRDSGDPTRTAQTAASLIESPRAAARAAQELGPDWDAAEVVDNVSVEPEGQSNILAITATADDANEAARVANTFTEAALDVRNRDLRRDVNSAISETRDNLEALGPDSAAATELAARLDRLVAVNAQGDPTMTLSQPAVPPTDSKGAGTVLIILLSLIGGTALAAGTAMVLDVMDRRIRDEDELASVYPGVPVLARVPLLPRHVLRWGSPQAMAPEVREAFRSIVAQLQVANNPATTIMVTSASTGDGKTSSALNFAASLTAGGNAVVLLDLDLRKPDVASQLGITPHETLHGVVTRVDSEEGVADLLVEVPTMPMLRVLSTLRSPSDVTMLDILNRRLPEILASAEEQADYVVIDTAPLGEVSDALGVAQVVDAILLVARLGHTTRRNLEITRDLLMRIGKEPTGCLLIGAEPGTTSTYFYGTEMAGSRGRLPFARPPQEPSASAGLPRGLKGQARGGQEAAFRHDPST